MVHVEVREAERDTRESDQIRRDVLDHRYFLTSIEQKKISMLFFHSQSQQTLRPFLKHAVPHMRVMARQSIPVHKSSRLRV